MKHIVNIDKTYLKSLVAGAILTLSLARTKFVDEKGEKNNMLNQVTLMGRLVKDVEIKVLKGANGEFSVGRFTLAVDRPKKKDQDKADTDFIICSSVGKKIEVIAQYFHKGDLIAVTGRFKTGSYDKDGHKVYTAEVDISDFSFIPQKKVAAEQTSNSNDFVSVPDGYEGLPFA